MTLQPQNRMFRRAVRGFYAWIGAFLLALFSPLVAERLVRAESAASRLAAVAIGTLGWVPLFVVVVAIIRAGDEYLRRLHLAAASVAFAAFLMLLLPLAWLVEARFIEAPSLQVLWVGCGLSWAVSLLVVKRRFERQT